MRDGVLFGCSCLSHPTHTATHTQQYIALFDMGTFSHSGLLKAALRCWLWEKRSYSESELETLSKKVKASFVHDQMLL